MAGYNYEKSGETVTFNVPSTFQPATVIAGLFFILYSSSMPPWRTIFWWVAIIVAIPAAIEWLLNRRNPPFTVSPTGVNAKGQQIDRDRINSIDVRNSFAGSSDTFLVEANTTNIAAHASASFAQRYYYVVSILHAGGRRTKLAGGLKADTAYSLVADIQRALNSQLR
ncbi:hypothetical protein [Sphingobium sp.]|uniref:hypothetical protein n=1 Tax=Sphingobium sp. TaxID=1912891 RepID=UPI002BC34F5C|nr:hypothetical protein [Sphingobium sp.]HUD92748.1 hypothetical protein [Sphingobium sp.]